MTRDDFKRQLNQLRGVIVRGLWNYEIRKALSPPEEVTVEILNRFNRFFVPVRTAVLQIMVIQFAEAFDRDRRAISLRRLVKAAQEYQCLIPYASPGQMDAIGQRLSYLENSKVLESIKRLRDQRWAHLDADPLDRMPLPKGEFDRFVEEVIWILDQLSSIHDRSIWNWSHETERCKWDVNEIIRILRENANGYCIDSDDVWNRI
jgi:hypothetical protein